MIKVLFQQVTISFN